MSQEEHGLPQSGGDGKVLDQNEALRARLRAQNFDRSSVQAQGLRSQRLPRDDEDDEGPRPVRGSGSGGQGGGTIDRLRDVLDGVRGKGGVVVIVAAVVLILAFVAWWVWPSVTSIMKFQGVSAPVTQAPAPIIPVVPAPALPTAPRVAAPNVRLPQLVTTSQPWLVPGNLPALLKDLNRFGSWLSFGLLILIANWAFHKERAAGGEEGDFRLVQTALVIFYLLGIVFPRGVIAALGDPVSWIAGRAIPMFVNVEQLVITLAIGVVVVGVVKAMDGIRDLTPASAAAFLVGTLLAWTQLPASTLSSFGFVMMGIGSLVLLAEFGMKDPKSKQRRLWSPIAAAIGFLVMLAVKVGLTGFLGGLIASAARSPAIPAMARWVIASYLYPLSGIIALLGGVVLGGFLATRWAGTMISLGEKLGLSSLGSHDEWDALLAMTYMAAWWFISHGAM